MKNKNDNYIESSIEQTPEQAAKNKKHRDSQVKAEKTKASRKVKDKIKQSDDNIQPITGRQENGDFSENNTFSVGNGRPPIFETPDKFNAKVNEYFDTGCKQITIGVDSDGNEIKVKKYTINGLTLFLGFSSKQSLYEYGKKDGFIDPIKRARTMIEEQYEEMLASKYSTGAIFALKNMNWSDKSEIKHSGETINKTIELSKEDYIQARKEMIENDEC